MDVGKPAVEISARQFRIDRQRAAELPDGLVVFAHSVEHDATKVEQVGVLVLDLDGLVQIGQGGFPVAETNWLSARFRAGGIRIRSAVNAFGEI